MPFPHQHLAQTISDQLNVLAAQLKTRTRASQTDANHWLESVMARFFNALMGWKLVNLNAKQSNYPAADLGDMGARIALQITNQDAASKISETVEKAVRHQLGDKFDRLILFFLLPQKPAMPKSFVQPSTGPRIECWDLADLLKQMFELPDQNHISAAAAVLEKEVGLQGAIEAPPPSNLPGGYIGQLFLGREDFLKDLRASLLKQTHTIAITQRPAASVTEGLGGLGKTHAAVEYAHRHRGDYTALLFVSGDTPQRLQTSLAALCDVPGLHLNDNLPPEEAVRASIALHWLTTHAGWLLIVDNVDDEPAALALREHFEQFRDGHVLITSRLKHRSLQVDSLDLSVLSQKDAIALLLRLTDKHRRKAADDAVKVITLAELMDGLPLALHQAAGYINEQSCTFAQYLTIYKDKAAELLNWSNDWIIPYERPDKSVPRPVFITWKTNFDQLDEETRRWLLVFSHFAPDPIPEFLLDDAPDSDGATKTLHHAASQALVQAAKFSLITRYMDDPPRFKMHRLVQEVMRRRGTAEDNAIAIALGVWLIVRNNTGDPQDVSTWKKWTPLQPHAQALCEHASDESAPKPLASLLADLSLLLKTKSLFAQAEPLIRRALKITEACFGLEHPNVAVRLNNLATLLQDMNQLSEAELLMRRSLNITESSYGPDHPYVAIPLANLGKLLQTKNQLLAAESLLRRGLMITENCKGASHPHVAIQLNNLAGLLYETNRLAEAESLMRRALQITEASYSPEHPAVVVILSSLAALLLTTNRYAQAEALMRRVLLINESCYGLKHPKVAQDLNNLAALLNATNRLIESEPLMRRALLIDEASFGPRHPNVANRLNNLASLLQAMNRLAEAEPLMRRALQIQETSFGSEHPNGAQVISNIASLLQLTNRLAEAEPLMRRALQINEASYGSKHTNVARDLNNLAHLLQETNRLAEAEPLMRRALQIDEASYGPEHPDVATDLNNLAHLLQKTDRLTEAEPLLRRALEIDEASHGLEHMNVARDLNNLAYVLQATNQLKEAEILMRRALHIDMASYGPSHPVVARDFSNLATLLRNTNRLSEAEPLMLRALQIDEASYGPTHPDVAHGLNNLALLLQTTNRLTEAEPLLRRALQINEASYGPEHPNVAAGLNNLGQLLKDMNRLAEAELLMCRALGIFVSSLGLEHPNPQTVRRNYIGLLQALKLPEAEIEQRVAAATSVE